VLYRTRCLKLSTYYFVLDMKIRFVPVVTGRSTHFDFDVLLLSVCVYYRRTSCDLPKIPEFKLELSTFTFSAYHRRLFIVRYRFVINRIREIDSLPLYVYWVVRLRYRTHYIPYNPVPLWRYVFISVTLRQHANYRRLLYCYVSNYCCALVS